MSTRPLPSYWQALRRRQLRRIPRCERCGAAATHVDHVIPRHRGGTNVRGNLQSLCAPCHRVKTSDELRELARQRRHQEWSER